MKASAEKGSGAPPSYHEATDEKLDHDFVAGLANLNIAAGPRDPTRETCLAHLKLLYAFQVLKEEVGYTDGLWNIWDARADSSSPLPGRDKEGNVLSDDGDGGSDHDKARQKALSQIREKRWALYVARAVDRYESWLDSIPDRVQLHEDDMDEDGSISYDMFTTPVEGIRWAHELPPLDVLLVWHAHMLNPRAYLEDCMRAGLLELWSHGMPWHLVDAAIDARFNYTVSDDAQVAWVAKTGRPWDNTEDSPVKVIACPACNERRGIPWTTSGASEDALPSSLPSLVGYGYGDGELDYACYSCARHITKDLLCVAQFRTDARKLMTKGVPMPGTVLLPLTGRPESYRSRAKKDEAFDKWHDPLRFPNQLVRQVLCFQLDEIIMGETKPSMDKIRQATEAVLEDKTRVRELVMKTSEKYGLGKRLVPTSRLAVRKMMACYWDNLSPFSLDLSGAVLRQGIFVEKMYRLDWLHSPVAPQTMDRICTKYDRFLSLIDKNPDKLCVPTLDVDLGWHTHQLSPSAYYKKTTSMSQGKFVDHNDKIDEDDLGKAFEWTSKTYQRIYQEVYSECTCWYCEVVRNSHISSVGRALGLSMNEMVADKFNESETARLCKPDNAAHISSHNAVKFRLEDADPNNKGKKAPYAVTVRRRSREVHQRRLDDGYERACRRAEKKGRSLPPRNDCYSHWGYPYPVYGPYIYPVYFTPGIYNCSDPCVVDGRESGCPGACAGGTCGGAVAAGSCGGAGGCGSAGGCTSQDGGGGGGCSGGCGGGCGGGD